MRLFLITLFAAAAGTAALSARDAVDSRPAHRSNDPDRTDRLKQYLAAFRGLPPATQARVRRLEKDIQEEDPATRARLVGVMERYALWLSHLSEADRKLVQAAPAGPERLRVVHEVMEQQWLDGLPAARKAQLANATEAERTTVITRWHNEERQRNLERTLTLRATQEMAILGQDERMKVFREQVATYVKNELEPKLTPKELKRLQTIKQNAPASFNYLRQVLALSELHRLQPPGPPDIWDRFRLPRK
jgi:hypothetical protein